MVAAFGALEGDAVQAAQIWPGGLLGTLIPVGAVSGFG
jgi:hypothetical protein